jgi:acylphosphatase
MSEPGEQGEPCCLRLKITGFVQSVGYRNFAIAEARKLGVDGWVRNRFDGSVEILVSGPTKTVETFIGLCMRGPNWARVDNVEMKKDNPPEVKGFNRRPSY